MFILEAIQAWGNWFWGLPILFLIVGGGIWIGCWLGFIQFRKFGYICSQTFGKMFQRGGNASSKRQNSRKWNFLIRQASPIMPNVSISFRNTRLTPHRRFPSWRKMLPKTTISGICCAKSQYPHIRQKSSVWHIFSKSFGKNVMLH